MNTQWQSILPRITNFDAVNIDDLLNDLDPRAKTPGSNLMPLEALPNGFGKRFKEEGTICIGVRVTEKTENIPALAMRLAGLAIERDVQIIVLSHLNYSGLERFGFRTERVCGATPEEREICEAQLREFWNLQVVI